MVTLPPPTVSSAARNALMITAAVAVGVALFFLRPILTPFALALFLMVIIDGLSRVLRRRLPSLTERWALMVAVFLAIPRWYYLSPVLLVGLFPLVRFARPFRIPTWRGFRTIGLRAPQPAAATSDGRCDLSSPRTVSSSVPRRWRFTAVPFGVNIRA